MSLRGRFAAAAAAVTLLTSAAAFSAVWLAYTRTQERELDATLLDDAEKDGVDAPTEGSATAPGTLTLRHGELAPGRKYAVVVDGAGRPVQWTSNLASSRPLLGSTPEGRPYDLWWNNEHLRAVVVPAAGVPGGRLFLATSRSDLDADNAYLARRMIAASLLASILLGTVTSWLARVLTRDHERIMAVARAVADGDLSARIGARSGDPELAQLGRDVDQMIDRLAELVERQQRFIANASHELRSPVTALLGELSLALRRERTADDYREALQDALESARRLKQLTEDLLAMARVGAGPREHLPVHLGEVTRAAVEVTRAAAVDRGVAVELSCDDVSTEGHPRDLERLVRNLLENAIRHSPAGGKVRVEARASAGRALLRVTDEGPGVPAQDRERIFEPFFRLPRERAEGTGTGLGLAIGRGIARAHGGDVWLEDSGHGARFVVELPATGSTRAA